MVSAKGLLENHEFSGWKGFGRIESRRETDGKVQTETRYFALSWMPEPEVFMVVVRVHRGIENALRWQLDESFREDVARNCKDHGPANIAILRLQYYPKVHTQEIALALAEESRLSDEILLILLN